MLKRIIIQLSAAGLMASVLLLPFSALATTQSKKATAKTSQVKASQSKKVAVKAVRKQKAVPATKRVSAKKPVAKNIKKAVVAVAPKPSYGQLAGLHGKQDALDLKSSVAFVVDQDTKEVLFSKNENAVLPIASITKLMTGVLISEARLPMEESIEPGVATPGAMGVLIL